MNKNDIPQGWKLVPIKPTDAVLCAMVRAVQEEENSFHYRFYNYIENPLILARVAYKAMIENNEKLNTLEESEKNEHEPAYYKSPENPAMIMTPERAKFLGFDLNELEALYTNPPQRKLLTDEQTNMLEELYEKAAKISGSAFLAGEKCQKHDAGKVSLLACEVLGGLGVLYHDLTGLHPELDENGMMVVKKIHEKELQSLNSADWSTEIKNGKVWLHIGSQSFAIDYDEKNVFQLGWMKKQLNNALSSIAVSENKPLTDEQIMSLANKMYRQYIGPALRHFVSDIEAAHGIKE